MNLLEIRRQFVKSTGRFDLVVDPHGFEDRGANFFIESAQKFLDNRVDFEGKNVNFEADIGNGDYLIPVPGLVRIENAYVTDSNGKTIRLWEKTRREVYDYLSTLNPVSANFQPGPPKFITKYYGRKLILNNLQDGEYSEDAIGDSVIITPRADKEYKLHVFGEFKSKPLKEDTDESWWSVNYPDILILASMYKLENFYRNTAGSRDHLEALDNSLMGIDFTEANRNIRGNMQMNNSFDT